jgi:hypothetical protein
MKESEAKIKANVEMALDLARNHFPALVLDEIFKDFGLENTATIREAFYLGIAFTAVSQVRK